MRCCVLSTSLVLLAGVAGAQRPTRPADRAASGLLTGAHRLEVEAGASFTIPVLRPAGAPEGTLHARAPRGWSVVPTRAPAAPRAARREARLELVSIVVPQRAAAGAYVVHLALGEGALSDSVVVVVALRRRVMVRLVSADEITVAGAPFVATFALANEGNAEIALRLAPWTAEGYPAAVTPATVTLRPGEEQEVRLRAETSRHAPVERRERVELRVYARSGRPDGADSIVARGAASLRLTPLASSGRRGGPRLPLRLTARSASMATPGSSLAGSPSLELAGGAALDARGRRRLDVLARVTGAEQSPFSERNELRIEYRGERLRLKAGDHSFGLSTLTEPGRSLFGVGAGVTAGPLDVQGFTARDRRRASGGAEHGGRVELRLPHGTTLGATALVRRGADSVAVGGGSLSLRPADWLRVDLEAATRADGTAGAGRAFRMSASQPWYGLSAGHVRGDAAFVGPWQSASQSWASLTLRPAAGVALEGSWRESDRLPSVRSPFAGMSRSREAALRVGGARLAYRRRARSSAWAGGRLAGEEESVELSARAALRAVSLDARAGSGVVTGAPESLPRYWRLGAGASARLGAGVLASASADYVDGATLDAPFDGRELTTQLAVRVPTVGSGELQLRAYERARILPDRPGSETRFSAIEGSLEQRLPHGHVAAVRMRAMRGTVLPTDEAAIQLEYSVPIGVPLPSRRDGGTVSGRVLDAETGRALSRMRVELGDRAVVTDASGRFVFRDVEPGRAFLTLDRRSLGADRTIVTSEAVPVVVGAGDRTSVDLPVARTGRLSGTIALFGAGPPVAVDSARPVLHRSGVVPNALVVLVRDDDVRRVRAGADGRFEVEALPPGRWSLTIAEATLPEHHRLDRDSIEVELGAGEHRGVQLDVVPQRLTIRMVAEAELTVDGPPGARAAPVSGAGDAALQGHYTVTRWDVGLADIALKVYGDATLWPKIFLASEGLVSDPDVVRVGTRLRVPRKTELSPAERAVAAAHRARWVARARGRRTDGARVPPDLQGYYTVTHWDVGLADIALKVYGDATLWPKIWLASRDLVVDPNVLVPGVRLRVPLPAPLTAEERAARDALEHREPD